MYRYEETKPELFTEHGSRLFLHVRDLVHVLLHDAGAFRSQEAWKVPVTASSNLFLACIDRLVELGEIREVIQPEGTFAQHRIFVKAI